MNASGVTAKIAGTESIPKTRSIPGLRTLYLALAAMVHRFHYLKYALAVVLILIGAKIFLGDWLFDGKLPARPSLSVTLGLLASGILFSLWKTRVKPFPEQWEGEG